MRDAALLLPPLLPPPAVHTDTLMLDCMVLPPSLSRPHARTAAAMSTGSTALLLLTPPTPPPRRYEDESHPGVCAAMEHAARCFVWDCDAAAVSSDEQLPGAPTTHELAEASAAAAGDTVALD